MSTLKVDTYLTRGGASEIAIDKLKGVTAAGSMLVVGEGGTTTTNLQQGLCKAWSHNNAAGTSIEDSFNIASLTDTSAGVQRNTFTSAMSNATYSAGLAAESSSESVSQWIEEINSARYDTRHYTGSAYVDCITLSHVHGDLA